MSKQQEFLDKLKNCYNTERHLEGRKKFGNFVNFYRDIFEFTDCIKLLEKNGDYRPYPAHQKAICNGDEEIEFKADPTQAYTPTNEELDAVRLYKIFYLDGTVDIITDREYRLTSDDEAKKWDAAVLMTGFGSID